MEDAVGCGAGGGDAARGPARVDFGEETGDLAPAGSFAGLARFADQDDEEIEAVTGGADAAVRGGADEVAEGGQELEEDGSGIGFGVRGKAADGETGKTVEVPRRPARGVEARRIRGEGRILRSLPVAGHDGLFFKVRSFLGEGLGCLRRPLPGLEGEQLPAAALYVGERGQGSGRVEGVLSEGHNMTLLRFRYLR